MNWKLSFYLLLSICFLGCKAKIDESQNIKKVLEKESATWRSGDSKGHASCWYIQPYSKILISTSDGRTIDVPPAEMVKITENQQGSGGTSKNLNYKMSIHKNNAWVSHDEESTAKNGDITYSKEIRFLEKINKEWKIVGQSIHFVKTE